MYLCIRVKLNYMYIDETEHFSIAQFHQSNAKCTAVHHEHCSASWCFSNSIGWDAGAQGWCKYVMCSKWTVYVELHIHIIWSTIHTSHLCTHSSASWCFSNSIGWDAGAQGWCIGQLTIFWPCFSPHAAIQPAATYSGSKFSMLAIFTLWPQFAMLPGTTNYIQPSWNWSFKSLKR